jgi:hypothetical protein
MGKEHADRSLAYDMRAWENDPTYRTESEYEKQSKDVQGSVIAFA